MNVEQEKLSAAALIARAFADLFKPPFVALVVLSVLLALVSTTFGPELDLAGVVLSLVLTVISIYLNLAVTLAAGLGAPHPSAEQWIRTALRRRVFLRYFLAGLLTLFAVIAGAVALLAGAFVLGAILAVSEPAAALGKETPFDALRRSSELTRGHRVSLGVVYGLLVIVPTATTQTAYLFNVVPDALLPAVSVVGAVLTAAAGIALARAYVILGGEIAESDKLPRRSLDS